MVFRKDLIIDSRLKAAADKKQTPLKIDKENQTGIFAGSDGSFYDTTLEECSCMDFAMQGYEQPCKHMIRLAMELNIIDNSTMQSDTNAACIKYHTGYVKEFIREASLADVISFARIFIPITKGGKMVPPDCFKETMDLPDISVCPLFSVAKNGTIHIEKKQKKEAENIVIVLRNRFGDEVLNRFYDNEFIEAFKTER